MHRSCSCAKKFADTLPRSALVVYEYLITFDQEVAIVWRKKITLTSAFLVIIRWAMVVNAIIANIVPSTDLVPSSSTTSIVHVKSVFSALRVSAIRGRNWFLFALVLALGSIPVWTNIMYVLISPIHQLLLSGTSVHLSTRISLIAMDFLVLILTWAKTFSQWRESRRLRIPKSIAGSLLRDGMSR
ncbi:uncharacterized protein PHACADRAFT_102465 [Phanerochaete carnosa HHB-10118-sp]|uniref:DUF6533 domain-containing protein n=1 Tax=Phanerochaete carnosa (strain HHB-10118-sp) TaxID=650164 RepID=K5WN10_PHACS|nr:uncharacterized protein PHACADRAFT_102465 [Phanerochaete carnosa HHB-10118-sp]EKM51717.1 hypothetical protein PHACADRAFT_102465 [Phanerochaete carnosa HHB-10118-sp]